MTTRELFKLIAKSITNETLDETTEVLVALGFQHNVKTDIAIVNKQLLIVPKDK